MKNVDSMRVLTYATIAGTILAFLTAIFLPIYLFNQVKREVIVVTATPAPTSIVELVAPQGCQAKQVNDLLPISVFVYPVYDTSRDNMTSTSAVVPKGFKPDSIQVSRISRDQAFLKVTITYNMSNHPLILDGWVLSEYMAFAGEIADCQNYGVTYASGQWLLNDINQFVCQLAVVAESNYSVYMLDSQNKLQVYQTINGVADAEYPFKGSFNADDGTLYIQITGDERKQFVDAKYIKLGNKVC